LGGELAGRTVVLGVRAEHIRLGTDGLPGRVELLEPLGNGTLVFFDVGGDGPLVANVEPETSLTSGDSVRFAFDATRLHLFDAATGNRLNSSA
ncbi:MAG: TOBE domain-containing protein, partial [Proteobacteria bacterium]|nr:TOBE domain-containing protein [Pseudomonadota bacterium]